MTDYGRALRIVRIRRGLTQGQLAARAGMARTHLVRLEGRPSLPQHYERLVHALDLAGLPELLAAAAGAPLSAPLRTALRATESVCVSCGTGFTPPSPTSGRPRKRCTTCASDRGAVAKAWRAQNRDRVEVYNAARRQATA